MDYKGCKVKEEKDRVIVENVQDFDPVHIFECGQCFRWVRQPDNSFTGVVRGKVANISYQNGTLVIKNSSLKDFQDIWFEYLDLGRDYGEIKALLDKDEHMKKAMEYGYGIRILKQDLWEVLISFIISANNRIPMIMKTVAAMSKLYGDEIQYDGMAYYSFPGADKLFEAGIEELEACRGGFRCKYILNTARMVKNGEVRLEELEGMDTGKAREELMKFPGVGPKVADCVLLYSGTKQDVFPTDVWVKRVMEELYFKREASFKEIQDFASSYFGDLAGFAQQYLFYYARENRIGTK
ncbi:8-oxoguanine DNA glycosylase [Clostridium thermosuccinogenes]|uniref:DNA-(apurinic or apyrimidinic site) lyase n=1 Tax=Clostridium thermosuccinogenes TaxID=84032 RepID=A0A2K2FDC7_9CLOT|nr:DNA glycosylase [Pseudoclostridium thermosuccinogenes]AUS95227.1 8-oxoguanine DNA glycosylase [Pseudoclostridium thermosuccinogenes]PNT96785.1 8-oxoguanine DNA glycosylase [Pseudoclostridium thermosuccinogenes]PNT98622.1 8-oxoguanine DNA glycosylase [Pseudoclostridium thermosuccinogenes]